MSVKNTNIQVEEKNFKNFKINLELLITDFVIIWSMNKNNLLVYGRYTRLSLKLMN